MARIAFTHCELCGCPLQWPMSDLDDRSGLEKHYEYVHPKMTLRLDDYLLEGALAKAVR